jgi:hypothetical protein
MNKKEYMFEVKEQIIDSIIYIFMPDKYKLTDDSKPNIDGVDIDKICQEGYIGFLKVENNSDNLSMYDLNIMIIKGLHTPKIAIRPIGDKENFEKRYCNRSNITRDYYNENFITLPCNCNQEGCSGWACVTNNDISIKAHCDLYI